jgi:hypothetical protein
MLATRLNNILPALTLRPHGDGFEALHRRFRDETTGSQRRAAAIPVHPGSAIDARDGAERNVSRSRPEADGEGRVVDSEHPRSPAHRIADMVSASLQSYVLNRIKYEQDGGGVVLEEPSTFTSRQVVEPDGCPGLEVP